MNIRFFRNIPFYLGAAVLALAGPIASPAWADGGTGGAGDSGGERGGDGGGVDLSTHSGLGGGPGLGGVGGTGGTGGTGGAANGWTGTMDDVVFTGGSGGTGDDGITGGGGGGGGGGGAGVVMDSGSANGKNIITGGNGGAGGNAVGAGGGGGGGQGGDGLLFTTGTPSLDGDEKGVITGGDGGNGGHSNGSQGGGGGDGGMGFSGSGLPGSSLSIGNNGGVITGGAGGAGGNGFGGAGAGGAGGTGVSGSHLHIDNNGGGTITGGEGGVGGVAGVGGVGISGSDLDLDNSGGTISGGMSGGTSSVRANAIWFTGGSSTLTLDSDSRINGGMANDGALTIYSSGTMTYDGVISGSGFTKAGSGTLILNGANTYTGTTTIDAGTLEVGDATHGASASISGDVNVGSGGTLRGHGTIGTAANTITNDGTVRPGGSIGVMTIPGNYTQGSGGTLMVDVSPTVASQLRVGGTATLDGTLSLLYGPGTYTTRTYTLVDAGTVKGKFATVIDNKPADVTAQTVTYTPTTVVLGITAAVVAPTNATIFGTAGAAALRENQRVNGVLLDRLGELCSTPGQPASAGAGSEGTGGNTTSGLDSGGVCAGQHLWARASGTDTRIDGNNDAPDARDQRYGFLAGLDRYLANGATVGLAMGYSHADVTEDTGDARAKLDTLRLAAYAGRRLGSVNVAGTLGYAYDFIATTRSFGSLGEAKDSGHGQVFTAGAQASLPWALGRATLTPALGVRYAHLDGFGLSEDGPTSQNLEVDNQHFDSLQPYAAVTLDYPLNLAAGKPARLKVRLGYAYETLDANHDVSVASIDGTRFVIPGTSDSRGMVTAGLGVNVAVSKATDAYLRYDTVFHTGNISAQSVQAEVSVRF